MERMCGRWLVNGRCGSMLKAPAQKKKWFGERFAGDPAVLPGTFDTNPRNAPAVSGDLQGFSARHPYSGMIWYQREIEIPGNWKEKRFVLFLERCQWETWVWVDDSFVGMRNSLVAPHIYDVSVALKPGKQRLTIMVDNSNRRTGMELDKDNMVKHYDLTTEVKAAAKLNCGGHHIWSHNWNGIIGRIELQVLDKVSIASVNVYPETASGEVRIRIALDNPCGAKDTVQLDAVCSDSTQERWPVQLSGEGIV